MAFGMTDARNEAVGQSIGLTATFDGDPFAADNGMPDGEATLHDRLLGLLKVAFVDLDRMHADPKLGVLVNQATVAMGNIERGSKVSATSLAHCIISLRQLLLSVNGAITQYGGADPSPTVDAQGILNTTMFCGTWGRDFQRQGASTCRRAGRFRVRLAQ